MSIPIRIEKIGDKFAATVVGMPDMRREGATSAEVIAAVRQEIQNRVDDGQIVIIDLSYTAKAESLFQIWRSQEIRVSTHD